jgi:hypothetical protein
MCVNQYIEVWRSLRYRQFSILLQGGHRSLQNQAVIYPKILSEKMFVHVSVMNQTTRKCFEKKTSVLELHRYYDRHASVKVALTWIAPKGMNHCADQ